MSDEPTVAAVLAEVGKRDLTCEVCPEHYADKMSSWCDRCLLASAARLLRHQQEALADIANPLVKLRAEAKAQGGHLNGMAAVALSEDANWLKQKAKDALAV